MRPCVSLGHQKPGFPAGVRPAGRRMCPLVLIMHRRHRSSTAKLAECQNVMASISTITPGSCHPMARGGADINPRACLHVALPHACVTLHLAMHTPSIASLVPSGTGPRRIGTWGGTCHTALGAHPALIASPPHLSRTNEHHSRPHRSALPHRASSLAVRRVWLYRL